jgi:ribosome biogenesis SPOUT family RNA methylase Rps3
MLTATRAFDAEDISATLAFIITKIRLDHPPRERTHRHPQAVTSLPEKDPKRVCSPSATRDWR